MSLVVGDRCCWGGVSVPTVGLIQHSRGVALHSMDVSKSPLMCGRSPLGQRIVSGMSV